jgi:phytoene synthase
LPVEHYENFPVASWLLPPRLREPIEAVYGFARGADDVADEGDASDAERLAALDEYLAACDAIERGAAPAPRFQRIARAVAQYALPVQLLRDLVDAFKQDVVKKRYATFEELRDYSRRSADPVGRLVLQIGDAVGFRPRDPECTPGYVTRNPTASPVLRSDNICSALQYINFWQDVALDWRKGRVYIPQEDLERFGVPESQIARRDASGAWRELMRFECDRARRMLHSGWPLARALPGRMGLEIRATIGGGTAILDRIGAAEGDVFRHRPVLRASDWVPILARAFIKKRPREASRS